MNDLKGRVLGRQDGVAFRSRAVSEWCGFHHAVLIIFSTLPLQFYLGLAITARSSNFNKRKSCILLSTVCVISNNWVAELAF